MASTPSISPLAPKSGFPDLPVIKGVQFSALEAGVRYAGRPDVMLAQLDAGSVVAGVFTKSTTRSASVLDCQAKISLDSDQGAAILVNSGNANAFTGKNGFDSVKKITEAVSDTLNIDEKRVFTSSTGVIGEPLKWDRITAKLSDLKAAGDDAAIESAAHAIMTTDTFAKGASATIENKNGVINIAGIAKGSGMIAPDMATMLVYIFTDAKISRALLQTLVSRATETTFNCITVDTDTSTSDTLLIAATGQSNADEILDGTNACDEFYEVLQGVMLELAHLVVRDGEGATKFIEVNITGAETDADARKLASAIANSPLIKTAAAGEDPNWGRVIMAIGKSGAVADRDLISISFGDILVAEKGWVCPTYTEEAGANYMKADDLIINVDMGLATGCATMWTCDLTHGYITINADYRS